MTLNLSLKALEMKTIEYIKLSRNLTLKVPITTAAEDIHKYFFIDFQRK